MRSISRFAAIVALAIAATGCANSSFNKAVDTNTARTQNYGEGFLEQAANDMTVVNDCWVNTKAKNADGTGCMMMSMALRMSNTFLYAFLGKPERRE